MQKKKQNNKNVPNEGLQPNLRFKEFESEWERKKLREVMIEGKLGGNYENSESNNGFPIIKMGNIGRGEIVLDKIQYLPQDEKYDSEDILKDGDLLFNTRNTLELVGKVAIWRNEIPFALYNSNLMRIKLNDLFEPSNRFLNAYFNTRKAIGQLRSFATGTTSVAAIYGRDLGNFVLSFPPVVEQKKIASFLSLIDERISTQNKIIEELKSLKFTLSKKIFIRQLRFDNFNKDWKIKRLGEAGTFFSGGTPLTSQRHYYNGNIPFIKSGEINADYTEQFISEEGLKNSSAKMVEVGDLIYALYGATSGEVGISKIRGAINQAILCIRTPHINTIFLLNYLKFQKESILKTYLQGGQGNLSTEIIKSLEIPIPHPDEQIKIADMLSAIDNKLELETAILNLLTKQKKHLLQQMFI